MLKHTLQERWGKPHPTKLLCCKLWPIGFVLVGEDSGVVAVVVADPCHVEREFIFVAAFGDQVEQNNTLFDPPQTVPAARPSVLRSQQTTTQTFGGPASAMPGTNPTTTAAATAVASVYFFTDRLLTRDPAARVPTAFRGVNKCFHPDEPLSGVG